MTISMNSMKKKDELEIKELLEKIVSYTHLIEDAEAALDAAIMNLEETLTELDEESDKAGQKMEVFNHCMTSENLKKQKNKERSRLVNGSRD